MRNFGGLLAGLLDLLLGDPALVGLTWRLLAGLLVELRKARVFSTRTGLCKSLMLGLFEALRVAALDVVVAGADFAGVLERVLVDCTDDLREGLRETALAVCCSAGFFAGLLERFLPVGLVVRRSASPVFTAVGELPRLLTELFDVARARLFDRL